MSIATPENSNKPSQSSLWKSRRSSVSPSEIASLPLEALQKQGATASVDTELQRQSFSEILHQLKEHLFSAKKSATLARTQSMPAEKRKLLCGNSVELFDRAQQLKLQLRSLAMRMGLEERRKLRGLEGAPEWREIRRAIQQSAALNKVKASFAA